ncbi:amidohydrolase family protein, partial [Salinispira pacifica]
MTSFNNDGREWMGGSELTIAGISIFSGDPLCITLREGTVASVERTDATPEMPWLSPGFIDLQVNGYRGIDYSSPTFDAADTDRLIRAIAESGTTIHLPTIITGPNETIVRNLSLLEQARRESAAVAAAIPGYHVEGPFISPEEGPRGAHSPEQVREADFDEFQRWQAAAGGRIRIVTVAPEVDGALDLIERMAAEGVLVSIGHTAASPEQIRDAVAAGARLSTHLGNGSHAVLPRLRNYLWEQLAADELAAGIIADGFHLPGAVVKTIARAK